MKNGRWLELLAPARDAGIAIEAIKHGADAVYIGARSYGARSNAANTVSNIGKVCEFAHRFNARVYSTINTILYEHELHDVEKLIRELYHVGVDALIIQDMGILRLDIPPIALHASTQCDIRDIEKARFLEKNGFSQLVLARELSLQEISDIHTHVKIPLEVFVHGALCVSYSGLCRAGFTAVKRSGNRGECPQLCRLSYSLIDGAGKKIITDKHLLSLKDMNRILDLKELVDVGVSSFKIEGRLKDNIYVKNTVTAYRKAIDELIDGSAGAYYRRSDGFEKLNFIPDLSKSFNRDYTDYFLRSTQPSAHSMARFDTPKAIGEKIGTVKSLTARYLEIKRNPNVILNNGDGLFFLDQNEKSQGFRINRVEENKLFFLNNILPDIKIGTVLYRNKDKEWHDVMGKETSVRKMYINFRLRKSNDNRYIYIDAWDQNNHTVTIRHFADRFELSNKPQFEVRKNIFSKLGETDWELKEFKDELGDVFIQASTLTSLRRRSIRFLEICREINRPIEYRLMEDVTSLNPYGKNVSGDASVSNSLAKRFYLDHGGITVEPAYEINGSTICDSHPVMQCRYCLRRELGACLKTGGGSLTEPLFLDSGKGIKYRLDFDCKNCRMKLFKA